MSMSYCRFENTAIDLNDCLNHIDDEELSKSEEQAKQRLIWLCKEIINAVGE